MSRNCSSRIKFVMTIIAVFGMLLPGCGRGLSESDVAYAGPMLDNILTGIADRDYGKFSRDFSEKMKDTVKEEDFDSLITTLDTKLGEYAERSFSSAGQTKTAGGTITLVTYRARYSKESNVTIKVYFSENHDAKSIEGLLIDSPSLHE